MAFNAGDIVVDIIVSNSTAMRSLAALQNTIDTTDESLKSMAGAAISIAPAMTSAEASMKRAAKEAAAFSAIQEDMDLIVLDVGQYDAAQNGIKKVRVEAERTLTALEKARERSNLIWKMDEWTSLSMKGDPAAQIRPSKVWSEEYIAKVQDDLQIGVSDLADYNAKVKQSTDDIANEMRRQRLSPGTMQHFGIDPKAYNKSFQPVIQSTQSNLDRIREIMQQRMSQTQSVFQRAWSRMPPIVHQGAAGITAATAPIIGAFARIGQSAQAMNQQVGRSLAGVKNAMTATGNNAIALGGKSNKGALAITQLGYAAEDAITVYGHMGLAGALRAAGNNLSFLASMMNPMAGLTVGVGIATAALIYQFSQMEKQANNTAKAINKMVRDMYRDLKGAGRDLQEDLIQLDQLDLGLPPADKYADIDPFEQKEAELQKMIGDSTRARERAEKELREATEGLVSAYQPDFGRDTMGQLQEGFSFQGARRDYVKALASVGGESGVAAADAYLKAWETNASGINVLSWIDDSIGLEYTDPGELTEKFKRDMEQELKLGTSIGELQNALQNAPEGIEGLEELDRRMTAIMVNAQQYAEFSGLKIEQILPPAIMEEADRIKKAMSDLALAAAEVEKYEEAVAQLEKNRLEAIAVEQRKRAEDLVAATPEGMLKTLREQAQTIKELFMGDFIDYPQYEALMDDLDKRIEEQEFILDPQKKAAHDFVEGIDRELKSLQKEIGGVSRAWEDGLVADPALVEEELDRIENEYAEFLDKEFPDKTINIKANFTGIEGVEAGSAEGISRIQGYFDQFMLDEQRRQRERDIQDRVQSDLYGEGGRPSANGNAPGMAGMNNGRDEGKELAKSMNSLDDTAMRLVEAFNRENIGLGLS